MRDIGAEVKDYMKHLDKSVKYTDEPIVFGKILPDNFLPSPAELAAGSKSTKVTIVLSRDSVDFFKREAEKHGGKYQGMIRRLLTEYARKMSRK